MQKNILLIFAALLFATPAWAEKMTVRVPIEDVLGQKGARVLHSHGVDTSVLMTVELNGYLYMCMQGVVDGKLQQFCLMEMENEFKPIPAD